MIALWQRATRLKTLDTQSLHYSEWSRKLGSFDLLGFFFCLGLPLGVFVTVPFCAKFVSGPSTLLSVIVAFVAAVITGLHFVEMAMRLPKSGSVYIYTYATFGELAAFLIGWLTIIDYTIFAAYVVKTWSLHMNYVFNKNPHEIMNPLMHHFGNDTIWEDSFDSVAFIGLLCAAAILSCSIKVAGTVCMVFATVCSLVVASSVLVGFFYTNAANWIKHGYFIDALPGVITSSAYLLRSFTGIEAVTCMTEEVGNYHSRLSFITPMANALLFLFHFLICAIMTLVLPYYQLPSDVALPKLFGLISVPASRYILSVGSVCGLSGSTLAVLIPPARILQNMSSDGLVFGRLAKITRRGVPILSHFTIVILASTCLFLKSDVLQDFLLPSLPIRCLVCTCVTLLQRYRDTPAGLLAEVAHYKNMKKLRSLTSFLSHGSVLTVPRSDSLTDDHSSITSSLIVKNIAAAQHWDRESSNATECKSATTCCEHENHADGKECPFKETTSLLSPTAASDMPTNGVVRSASKYKVPNGSSSVNSLRTVSLDDNRSLQVPHDCLRSPCTPLSDDPCFHMYQRDIPEMPYANKFDSYTTSNTAINQTIIYGKAKLALMICVLAMFTFACVVTKCWRHVIDGRWWSMMILVACVIVTTGCVGYFCWLPKNIDSTVRHQVAASPYLSLFNCLLLCSMLSVINFGHVAKLLIVLIPGLFIYILYGYRHSVENTRSTINVSMTNEEFHDNNQIVNCVERSSSPSNQINGVCIPDTLTS